MAIHLNDSITVMASASLSQDDLDVLHLLYQPLIGHSALSAYLTMQSIISRQCYKATTLMHHAFIDLLNMNLSTFETARERLEAMNLLNVYQSEHAYVYLLKQPLTAKQFFQDGILGVYLKSQLSEGLFSHIEQAFTLKKIEKGNFINITKSFDDVFQTDGIEGNLTTDAYLLGKKVNRSVNIKQAFSTEAFFDQLPKLYKPQKNVELKVATYIKKIAYVYGFNELEMANIFTNTMDPSGDVDFSALSKSANNYYKMKHKDALPKLHAKTQKDKEVDPRIHALSNMTPQIILEQDGQSATARDLEIIEKLSQSSLVEMEVINALVAYVLKIKEGKLPTFNYLNKVLNEWRTKGIVTAKDAVEYLFDVEQYHEPKKTYTHKKPTSAKPKPEWLDDYIEAFNKREES